MSLNPQVWSTYKKHRETIKTQVVDVLTEGKTPVLTFSKIMDMARFVEKHGVGKLTLTATFTETALVTEYEAQASAPKPVKEKVPKAPKAEKVAPIAAVSAPSAATATVGGENWDA